MKNLNSFPPVVQGRSNAGDARAWPIHKEGVDDLILIFFEKSSMPLLVRSQKTPATLLLAGPS